MEATADEFDELTEWKELMGKLKDEYGDHIEPFFTKKSPFSNHFMCDVEVEGVHYKSTEHCLFTQKALHCKDNVAAAEIASAETAAAAMKRGQKVHFPGGLKSWHHFAKRALEAANFAKFSQNDALRKHLFSTSGKRLVEASTDPFWGCGHAMDVVERNPKYHDPNEWRGYNVMGDILTHLRSNLMGDDAYRDEAATATKEAMDRASAKRQRESPGLDN
ncbi:MAG: NADAR family protein, partial [Proteobacteria bacterium]|nr:NADAR family protein [Pseudomonadota bacterium]